MVRIEKNMAETAPQGNVSPIPQAENIEVESPIPGMTSKAHETLIRHYPAEFIEEQRGKYKTHEDFLVAAEEEAKRLDTIERVKTNAILSDKERVQKAQKLMQLTPEQQKAVLEAHRVGKGQPGKDKGPAGVGNYTMHQLGKKLSILEKAGLSKEERFTLVKEGLVGVAEAAVLVEKAEKDARELGPEHWMARLQELHRLPRVERQAKTDEYAKACREIAKYAHGRKLSEGSPTADKVTILEEQLTDFEQKEIENGTRTQEEKEVLKDLLDDLERSQNTRDGIQNSLNLKTEAPDLFSENKWDEMQKQADDLQLDITRLRTEVGSKTTSNFLAKRDKLKKDIDTAKKTVEDKQKIARQQELGKQRGEVDPWVTAQENRLLHEIKPTQAELGVPPNNLPAFADALNGYNQQQQFKDAVDPRFSQANYDRAKVVLAWYFHEGREQGALGDKLEDTLNNKYQEWASDLMSHREVNPYDGSVRIIQRTFTQIQDEMIEYFGDLLNPSKAKYVEHSDRWNTLQRHGVSVTARARLQGVRAELVRRAQIQIEDSLLNLDRQLHGQPFIFTSVDRISGEWNVHRLERMNREERENQRTQERTRPLFRHESYYSIDLLGTNRGEVELGADQAADYIIGSAMTFSLDVVRQKMDLLTQGLEKKIGTIEASEKISRQEATDIIHEIQRKVTNKMDFFILDWTAANLLMDQFAGYYSDRMRMDGDQKLKRVPAMSDGLAGLAINWLTSDSYELYHRPQGFKGQLYDDDQTHKTERALMKEQIIQRLMKYELRDEDARSKLTFGPTVNDYLQSFSRKGTVPPGIIPDTLIPLNAKGQRNPTEFFEGLSSKNRLQLFDQLTDTQSGQLFSLIDTLTPDERVDIRQWEYNKTLKQAQAKEAAKTLTLADLAAVREAAIRLAEEKSYLATIRTRAESAFDTADKVLNIFGEAAYLGAPSIIMDNGSTVAGPDGTEFKRGDYISINDYKLVQKYAILATDHGEDVVINGVSHKVKDNEALIRWRSRMFIAAWKKTEANRGNAREKYVELVKKEYKKIGQEPPKFMLDLAEGFEETGLTKKEWEAFKKADTDLRVNGYLYKAADGTAFDDILKKDELQPVLNNFLADYKSSESEINNPYVIEKAARGKMVSIANIRKRLHFTGRRRLEGTTQQEIDEYTQRIEDSRSLDAELERLTYFAASHDIQSPPMMWERGRPVYAVSADRIDYGYQRQSWGVKRLHHLKAFWYANLRRTVPRAEDLIHAIPITLTSLSREHSFDNFLQMCFDINKMESIDNPGLVMTADRHKDQAYIRGRGEGSVAEGQGGLKKAWGFWEKPLVDAGALWKLMNFMQSTKPETAVEQWKNNPQYMDKNAREQLIQHLQDVFLSRLEPMLSATEKSLGEDRQALSAGSGYEELEKFAMRFLEWLLSEKAGNRREQGGILVNENVKEILRMIIKKDTYAKGASLWDEVWRKLTPSHNPALSTLPPQYSIA